METKFSFITVSIGYEDEKCLISYCVACTQIFQFICCQTSATKRHHSVDLRQHLGSRLNNNTHF